MQKGHIRQLANAGDSNEFRCSHGRAIPNCVRPRLRSRTARKSINIVEFSGHNEGAEPMDAPAGDRTTVSPRWLQAILVTFLFGFAILGYLAIRVYQDHPPLPERVVSERGDALFTGDDIRDGQELFLTYGLMQYGSIYGHGAYLGPDFAAEYLALQALAVQEFYGNDDAAESRTREELQANRYDPARGILVYTDGQVRAFEIIRKHYEEEVLNRRQSGGGGLGPHAISDPEESRKI